MIIKTFILIAHLFIHKIRIFFFCISNVFNTKKLGTSLSIFEVVSYFTKRSSKNKYSSFVKEYSRLISAKINFYIERKFKTPLMYKLCVRFLHFSDKYRLKCNLYAFSIVSDVFLLQLLILLGAT